MTENYTTHSHAVNSFYQVYQFSFSWFAMPNVWLNYSKLKFTIQVHNLLHFVEEKKQSAENHVVCWTNFHYEFQHTQVNLKFLSNFATLIHVLEILFSISVCKAFFDILMQSLMLREVCVLSMVFYFTKFCAEILKCIQNNKAHFSCVLVCVGVCMRLRACVGLHVHCSKALTAVYHLSTETNIISVFLNLS